MTNTGTIAENRYGSYSVPEGLDHRPAVRLVKAGDVYEPDTIAFMRDHAGAGDVIHAGTFFGDFLPGLSAAMAKGAKIWAYQNMTDILEHPHGYKLGCTFPEPVTVNRSMEQGETFRWEEF